MRKQMRSDNKVFTVTVMHILIQQKCGIYHNELHSEIYMYRINVFCLSILHINSRYRPTEFYYAARYKESVHSFERVSCYINYRPSCQLC